MIMRATTELSSISMVRDKQSQIRTILKQPIIWAALFAALLYSWWPLGYWLNPPVASGAFASQLQAPNQPYNWLFIALDLLSGLIVFAVGIAQWRTAKNGLARLCILGYGLFGLLVIVAALVPFDCDSLSMNCIYTSHSPLLMVHGLASTISVVTLFVSMLLLIKLLADVQARKRALVVASFITAFWVPAGLLALHFYHHADENLVQYAFITLCSLSLAITIILLEQLTERLTPVTTSR
jgi:hypothetical protein